LGHLGEMTNLKQLAISNCDKITDKGITELVKALPNCEIYTLAP